MCDSQTKAVCVVYSYCSSVQILYLYLLHGHWESKVLLRTNEDLELWALVWEQILQMQVEVFILGVGEGTETIIQLK